MRLLQEQKRIVKENRELRRQVEEEEEGKKGLEEQLRHTRQHSSQSIQNAHLQEISTM